MNLGLVYKDMNFGLCGYPDAETKALFGKRGISFCRGAAKLAGVTPVKGYPYHNIGGIAVFGEVYFYIDRPDGERLEIILAESGPYYRTNGPRGYGVNINLGHSNMLVMGRPSHKLLAEWTEEKMAQVIKNFMEAK